MINRATKAPSGSFAATAPSGSIYHRPRNGMGYSLYSIELQRSSAKAMSYYLVKQLKNMFIFNSDNFLDMIPGRVDRFVASVFGDLRDDRPVVMTT